MFAGERAAGLPSAFGVLASVAAATLACALEPEAESAPGHPVAWLSSERVWWVTATLVPGLEDADAAGAFVGVSSEVAAARFVRQGERLVLLDASGSVWASFPTEARSGARALAVDWGGSRVPVTLQPGWVAQPRPSPSRPFAETAADDAHRVSRDYIEWTVPATIEVPADQADDLGRKTFESRLRFSAVPRQPSPFVSKAADDRFDYRGSGPIPRLDLFSNPEADWRDRLAESVTIEAAPALPVADFEALREAVRRVSTELQAALAERGAVLPPLPLLRAVPSPCSVDNLTFALVDHPELSDAVRAELCPAERPLCFVDRVEPERAALEAACRQVAAATWDPVTGRTELDWARPGDLRFHLADVIDGASPLRTVAASAIAPSGQILRMEIRANLDRSRAIADRVGHWTERLLAIHPDDGPRPEELLSVLEWAALNLQGSLLNEANAAFLPRLRTRAEIPPVPTRIAQLARAQAAARVAANLGIGWSSANVVSTSTALEAELARAPSRARLAEAGLWLEDPSDLGALNLAVRFGTAGAHEARRRTEALSSRHRWLFSLLLALGLSPNAAASSDPLNLDPTHRLTASVLDELPLVLQPELTDLAPYDRAALRYAYADQIRAFDLAQPDLTALRAFIEDNGPVGLVDHLCESSSCPDEAARLATFSERSWVPAESAPDVGEVPFARCGLEAAFAGQQVGCRWRDWGVLPQFAMGFELALFRGEAWLADDPRPAWRRATSFGRAALRRLAEAPSAPTSFITLSSAAAVADFLNATHELSIRPEPGPRCLVDGGLAPCSAQDDPVLFLARGFGPLPRSAELLERALASFVLADPEVDLGARFTPELRQIAAEAVGSSAEGPVRWCPDPIGRLDRGGPSFAGVIDPETGGPDPVGRCQSGLPLSSGSALEAPLNPGPYLLLLSVVGASTDPTLAIRTPPRPEDCAFTIADQPFGSPTALDSPSPSLGCHVLGLLEPTSDGDLARGLAAATRTVSAIE